MQGTKKKEIQKVIEMYDFVKSIQLKNVAQAIQHFGSAKAFKEKFEQYRKRTTIVASS